MWTSQCNTVIRVRTSEIKTAIRGALLSYERSPGWRGWTGDADRARRELRGIHKVNYQHTQDENTLKPYKLGIYFLRGLSDEWM